MPREQRKLAAILAADVDDHSRLWGTTRVDVRVLAHAPNPFDLVGQICTAPPQPPHRGHRDEEDFGDSRLVQRAECSLDAPGLSLCDHAFQDLLKSRMRGAGEDVLPAIGLEKLPDKIIGLLAANRPAAICGEVFRIGSGLHLQDSVDGPNERDKVVDGAVTLILRKHGIVAFQFQLVELDVLALVLPVEEKHVLEQFRQLAIGLDTQR